MAERMTEFSFLDLFVIIAESWILLLIGPAIVVVVAFFLAQLQDVQYRSVVEILVDPPAAGEVLPELQAFIAAADNGVATIEMSASSDSVFTIEAYSATPSGAAAGLQGLWDELRGAWVNESGEEHLARVAALDARVDDVTNSIKLLQDAVLRSRSQTPFDAAGYAALVGTLEQIRNSRLDIEERLAELATPVAKATVVRGPTPAQEVGRRSPLMIALAAGLGAGFALLIFIFARYGLRSATASPEGAEKVARVKRAFYLVR